MKTKKDTLNNTLSVAPEFAAGPVAHTDEVAEVQAVNENFQVSMDGTSTVPHEPDCVVKPVDDEKFRPWLVEFKSAAKFLLQVCFFLLISEVGNKLAITLELSLPGNIVGVGLLLILLAAKVVKIEWIEFAGSALTRHMAFFFIPITVGLMSFGDLLKLHGVGILATLIVSAAVGIVAAGWSVQAAQSRFKKKKEPQQIVALSEPVASENFNNRLTSDNSSNLKNSQNLDQEQV